MEGATAGFRSLLEEKEKEILNIHESKVSELENQILGQKKEFLALENLYVQLQEDFKYNLALLDDRDVELEQYESLFEMIEVSLKEKDSALEELRNSMSKSETDYLKEKEELTNCQNLMLQQIQCLQLELEKLQVENDAKLKKQAQSFELRKEEMKSEVLEKEKQVRQLKKFEEEHVQNLEKQLALYQCKFDAVELKLHNMETNYMQFEKAMKSSLDDKSRRIEELTFDIRKIIVDDDNVRNQYENNLRRLRDDAKVVEKKYLKCISKEAEKNARLMKCLESTESRLHDVETTMAERLRRFSRKVQTMEQELLDLKAYESKSNQKIENHYSELIQLHEIHLKEGKQEVFKWKTECDNLYIKCTGLEKLSLQNKELEAENCRLQESLIELKDENEKIQKVVAMLRLEMEALQDATLTEKTEPAKQSLSGKQFEVEAEKDIKQELDFLKQRITSISSKLDGIHSSVPVTRKPINSSEPLESNFSDEKLSAKISELEQTQMKLKTQLEATLAHAAKLADERDLLMDLNNSLHADLSRSLPCHCVDQQHVLGCKERQTQPQNNPTVHSHCCATWNRCSGADPLNRCCNTVLPNPNTHEMVDPKVNTSKNRLHVEGNNARYHERTTSDIIHKGTLSQHARLKSLFQTKPKVRNYNIKDDDV